VLKPGVEAIMQSDLSFVYLSMKVLQFLNPELQRASLVDIVGELSVLLACVALTCTLKKYDAWVTPQGICDLL